MALKISTISIVIGILIGGLSILFMKPNSNLRVDKINEIIELNQIEEGDSEKLNEEIKALVEAGLIVNYLSINFYIGIGMVLFSAFNIFFGVYLIIDKLFFKKFYETPDYFDAVRRGLFLCLTIAFIIYFRLLNVGIELIVSLPIIAILLEIGFYKYVKQDFILLYNQVRHKVLIKKKDLESIEKVSIEQNME